VMSLASMARIIVMPNLGVDVKVIQTPLCVLYMDDH
jgi:hypothetical protein